MRNTFLYAIVTIMLFAYCLGRPLENRSPNIPKDSTVLENASSTTLPLLDTTIILKRIKNHPGFSKNITEKEGQLALYRYFDRKGVVSGPSSDQEKVCVDYDTLYPVHTGRFSGAIISYWLGECDLNGHCFQPSKAIISRTISGLRVSNENFIPTNFTIDSTAGPIVYGYDYDCGDGILRSIKITLQE